MNSISLENRIKIIKIHYENGGSVRVTFRKIRDIFGHHKRPSETAIKNLVDKFESRGWVHNVPTPTRVRPGRSSKNIAAVSHSVEEDSNLSIPRRSQQLGISKTTTWRILRKDLALNPCKQHVVQELESTGHSQTTTKAKATGRGRGRPPKNAKPAEKSEDENNDDENEEASESDD